MKPGPPAFCLVILEYLFPSLKYESIMKLREIFTKDNVQYVRRLVSSGVML